MVVVSYSGKEINAKLVYYGPGLSGKTTNLEYIYQNVPNSNRGKMVSMKTRTERTLFFDFLPIDLGDIGGFKTRFLLYTVPGQVYYNATRKLVLRGVDAIIFVADSQRGKMEENIESLQNLRDNLREYGLSLDEIPWVIQYNKRDMPDVYSVEELEEALNPEGVPSWEVVATGGQGVFESFRGIAKLLLQKLGTEIKLGDGAAKQVGRATTPPASPAAPAAPTAPAPGPASGASTSNMGLPGGGRPYRSAPPPGARPTGRPQPSTPAAPPRPAPTPAPAPPAASDAPLRLKPETPTPPSRPIFERTAPVQPAPEVTPDPAPGSPEPTAATPANPATPDLSFDLSGTETPETPVQEADEMPIETVSPESRAMPIPAEIPLAPTQKTPAEEEAALAAEIEKRAADARLKREQEATIESDADIEYEDSSEESAEETPGEKRGFWSRLFRRGQDEDKVAEFYGEPDSSDEDADEAEDYAVEASTPAAAGEDGAFYLKSSEDLETGSEESFTGMDSGGTEGEEEIAETPMSAPTSRMASIDVPLGTGQDDRGPVVIHREVQVPITLGPEDVLRGARLRLVLEIQVEASESDEDSDRQSRVA